MNKPASSSSFHHSLSVGLRFLLAVLFLFISLPAAASGASAGQIAGTDGQPLGPLAATVYVAADLDCAGNSPCYATIAQGLANVDLSGFVYIYSGDYAEDLVIDKEVFVVGQEDFSVQNYHQTAGHFYPPANFRLSGDFTVSSYGFHHNLGAVHFTGADQTIQTDSSFFDIFTELSVDGYVRMASQVYVVGNLHMDRGVWLMGAHLLVMDPAASFSGGDANSFIYPEYSSIQMDIITADPPAMTFPIGDTADGWDYSPVTLDMNNVSISGPVGWVLVRLRPVANPHNTASPRIKRYWIMEPSNLTSFTWDGVFTYLDSDILGSESELYAARYNSSSVPHWTVYGLADPDKNTLSFTNVSGFSEFSGTPAVPLEPTAVEMAEALAVSGPGTVVLNWQTETESHTSGFFVYRSASPDGLRLLMGDLIPAEGGLEGASYSYVDTSVLPGKTYYYWIYALSADGMQYYGPYLATVKPPLYLPLVLIK
jgi:hypothetical protein